MTDACIACEESVEGKHGSSSLFVTCIKEEMTLSVSIFWSHNRGSGKSKNGNRITGVGRVEWKKVERFFFSQGGYVVLLLPRRNSPTNLPREASNSSKTPRRSPNEAFFPIPSTLFESAIASPAYYRRSSIYYPTLRRKSCLMEQTTFNQE